MLRRLRLIRQNQLRRLGVFATIEPTWSLALVLRYFQWIGRMDGGLGVTLGAAQVAMEEMTPEDLFHTLLGLGTQWRVMRCEFGILSRICG